MEKQHETEWKNDTIQTTLHCLQKLERRNGKTTRDRMEKRHNPNNFALSAKAGEMKWKKHNSDNFALSAKARVRMERDFYFFSQLHTLLDTSKASAMIQTFPLPFHLRTVDHAPGKVAGTTPIISSHQNQSESQKHRCVCGCVHANMCNTSRCLSDSVSECRCVCMCEVKIPRKLIKDNIMTEPIFQLEMIKTFIWT